MYYRLDLGSETEELLETVRKNKKVSRLIQQVIKSGEVEQKIKKQIKRLRKKKKKGEVKVKRGNNKESMRKTRIEGKEQKRNEKELRK